MHPPITSPCKKNLSYIVCQSLLAKHIANPRQVTLPIKHFYRIAKLAILEQLTQKALNHTKILLLLRLLLSCRTSVVLCFLVSDVVLRFPKYNQHCDIQEDDVYEDFFVT